METNGKILKTEQGSCMSGLWVWVRVTINKLMIPDAKGWPLLLIVTRDTSILRYIDTFIHSMPRLDLVVYDSSPSLRGKLLLSHTTIDTL